MVTDARDARDHLPARAAGLGTFAWGGAAGTYFFCDPVNQLTVLMVTQVIDGLLHTKEFEVISVLKNQPSNEIYGQVLQYSLGCPTLRPELCRKCYCLFPELRAVQEAAEERDRSGGENKALSGFTG